MLGECACGVATQTSDFLSGPDCNGQEREYLWSSAKGTGGKKRDGRDEAAACGLVSLMVKRAPIDNGYDRALSLISSMTLMYCTIDVGSPRMNGCSGSVGSVQVDMIDMMLDEMASEKLEVVVSAGVQYMVTEEAES